MYFQVYYHPGSRSYELLLEGIYERIKDLVNNNIHIDANIESFINVVKNNDDVDSYIELDDASGFESLHIFTIRGIIAFFVILIKQM